MIHVGTAGYGYHDWTPSFYPPGLVYEEYLSYYSERLDCCELNSTFYRWPTWEELAGMLRRSGDRLAFTVRYRVDRDGRLSGLEANRSVIHSRRRCTYDEVAEWLDRPRAQWPREAAAFEARSEERRRRIAQLDQSLAHADREFDDPVQQRGEVLRFLEELDQRLLVAQHIPHVREAVTQVQNHGTLAIGHA